jgi:hypothetical protein
MTLSILFLGWGAVGTETIVDESQLPGNDPEENIQHTEHGESFKSRIECF